KPHHTEDGTDESAAHVHRHRRERAHSTVNANALAESFWQGLKRETMHGKLFVTMQQARLEIFQWLTYYNVRRRHSALGYLSPMEFEQQHHQTAKLSLAA
ncbi:integrase core domain-containing protein, partial [Streptomyces sp. NPDC005125]